MTDMLTETEMNTVQEIVMNQLHVTREQLTSEAQLMADLGADSLDMVEIAMGLEEAFNVVVPDDEAEKVVTMQDLYDVADALLRGARA